MSEQGGRVWAHLRRSPGAMAGLALVVAAFLVAVYAPFLCGEAALLRHDPGQGLSSPVLADLFNRWSYRRPHDLVFNLAALLLPPLALGWWALRRWSPLRRLRWSLAVLALATAACWLPLVPDAGGWKPLWRERALPAAAAVEGRWELPPPIPHRFDSTWQGAVLAAPGTRNPATGARFWLGTDSVGRDVAAQVVMGARISLTVGLVATALAMAIGLVIGALSGFLGGWTDLLLQRLVEIMMCFPIFILVLVVVAMLGRDVFIIMTVIGLTGWAGTARLVRGEFLAQSVRDYVAAGRALGLPAGRLMFRHILPNAMTPLLISATFGVAGAVGSEAALSFIGLGDPTAASWGALLEQGRQNIRYAWLIYVPGLAVFALVTALNLVGNALREALDPKRR
jgi:peptide/nickel transport system permease protein